MPGEQFAIGYESALFWSDPCLHNTLACTIDKQLKHFIALPTFLFLSILFCRRVLPLSLLSYRTCVQKFALPRQCLNPDNPELFSFSDIPLGIERNEINQVTKNSQCCVNFSDKIKNGQYLPLESIFRKHVKPKKQHEILNLGKVHFPEMQFCQHDKGYSIKKYLRGFADHIS